MKFNFNIDYRLLGLIGSILLIISQFLSWFSGYSLIEIFIITTSVELGNAFLYLFPLVSGSICLVGTLLIYIKRDYRINSIIINFIGFAFFLVFIFELIPQEIIYILNAGIGFYISIIGAILIFFHNLNVLLTREKSIEGS
ncbi:MAG: hypothetical protein ACFFFB_01150 [Candidatus Heimdallarchaeota archaeon]